ncbi:helix-turn-helix domain-containing protein [Neobacillus sp. D3-1R]|uniref:helix-turn-helix domain-containing protein n=1 Tax=Neobacillus sp. D3-1R TaxID=3445778 RepID=UPI003FA080CE
MSTIMLGLLALAVILILLSFFLKDPYDALKEEMDQMTLQQAQEMYQIKKKISVLEEELLMDDFNHQPRGYKEPTVSQPMVVHDIIKNQVFALAQQGKTIDQIARQSSLSPESVLRILNDSRGTQYE